MIASFALATAIHTEHRLSGRVLLRWTRSRDINVRSAVLISVTHVRKINENARANPWMGTCVGADEVTPSGRVNMGPLPAFGSLEEYAADHSWLALLGRAETDISHMLWALDEAAVTAHLVPNLFRYEFLSRHANELAGISAVPPSSRITGCARYVKAVEGDALLGLILILATAAMLILALGVKLSSPSPALFEQKRHGLGGDKLQVRKIRSI